MAALHDLSAFDLRALIESGEVSCREAADAHLARIVRRCRDLPGEELFQYVDDRGVVRIIESQDVNDYLRTIADGDFTAKDFRTWAGTMICARLLQDIRRDRPRKQDVVAVIKQVAERLGNTPAVCRKSYIHPVVVESYLSGRLRSAKTPAETLLALLQT